MTHRFPISAASSFKPGGNVSDWMIEREAMPMADLVPIGRFAQIVQLSIKALRLYAEQGLLLPSYIDPETGYRYYRVEQATAAARIRLLRTLEMPLEDIRVILQAPTPALAQAMLEQHYEQIAHRVARYQAALPKLRWLIEHGEEFLAYDINVKEIPDQLIISRLLLVPEGKMGQQVSDAMQRLIAFAIQHGVFQPLSPAVVIHHRHTEEAAEIEIGLPIEQPLRVESPPVSTILPGGPMASVVHIGSYRDLGIIFPALAAWIHERGYTIRGSPRSLFQYKESLVEPAEARTELLWPIAL
jgi:DNA-binding transcriptional MerR regulator